MIIGDKNTIAVELEVLPANYDSHQFAKGAFWLFGESLGNSDEVSQLALLLSAFDDLLERISHQNLLEAQAIFDSDRQELLSFFESELWVSNHYANKNNYAVTDALSFFALPVGIELFDGEKIYLIRGSQKDRVIWSRWGEAKSKSNLLSKGDYQHVIENVIQIINEKKN